MLLSLIFDGSWCCGLLCLDGWWWRLLLRRRLSADFDIPPFGLFGYSLQVNTAVALLRGLEKMKWLGAAACSLISCVGLMSTPGMLAVVLRSVE